MNEQQYNTQQKRWCDKCQAHTASEQYVAMDRILCPEHYEMTVNSFPKEVFRRFEVDAPCIEFITFCRTPVEDIDHS